MLIKNAQILGAIQKVRTLWWRRGEGYSTNVRKRTRGGVLPRVYVSLWFFKRVFSHLNCLCFFVFHFFNGKVKTLTPWKVALYIAANLTLSRYLDSSFYKCNVQIQLDYNFFQLKKQITQKNQIWTLFQQKTFKSNSDVLG